MSKVAELAYDIEQLYIDGYSPRSISVQLGCPIETVYAWMDTVGCAEDVGGFVDVTGWTAEEVKRLSQAE
jgi:hypothetical protein